MRTPTREDVDIYRIRGTEAAWRIELNDEAGMAYASKEAAFEAAVASASNGIRAGREVVIVVPGARDGESLLGTQDPSATPWSALS
ncbi:hypothetical protein [Ancylobacter oerskovii]|uniref:DUF2188 domain-containing protein n=1 Tax=Ancylobacter oerskovii TaxID=459519 RepID=A0ABW4Z2D1_9HYPH|nr:hypothetical protein [Ancylobacter oerskovii]MBS7544741.1 hypothetical protein [Ancylobacter oerskovii]